MTDTTPEPRHGRETFFIEGEGLVGGDAPAARQWPSPRRPPPRAPPRRSGSRGMGPKGRRLGAEIRKKVGRAMTDAPVRNGEIPAGYTYLGQFVDHDLTFDATTVAFGDAVSPADLLQGRSPTLDLDSVYGAGPLDPESAKFYEADRLHLKMGRTTESLPDKAMDGFDLPRVGKGSAANRRKALIPDRRNDENLAVAQHHLAMIRFHNRVVDKLPASTAGRRQVPAGPAPRGAALPVDAAHRLPHAGSATPRSWTTCSPTGARCSRSAPTR